MAYTKLNSEKGAVWKHNKKLVGDKEVEIEASNKTFIEGYYMGSKEININANDVSTLHSLKFIQAGEPDCIHGDIINDTVGVWGSNVINDLLSEVPQGTKTMIVFKGKKKNQSGTREYNVFEVGVDHDAELFGGEAAPVGTTTQTAPEPASKLMEGQKNDGLPF